MGAWNKNDDGQLQNFFHEFQLMDFVLGTVTLDMLDKAVGNAKLLLAVPRRGSASNCPVSRCSGHAQAPT